MKKLAIIGVALAVGVLTMPAVSHAQTASGKSPYCNIASKKWSTNWGDYYHCYGTEQSGEGAR